MSMDMFCPFRRKTSMPIAVWRRRRRRFGESMARWTTRNASDVKFGVPFTRPIKLKPGETVVFAYILFASRAQRDRVNAKVMKDPRLADSMDMKSMPFDHKRMVYGGFKVLVEA